MQNSLEVMYGVIYPTWYWDTSGFRRESCKVLMGRGTFGILCFACCYCDQIPDKWKMDGWMFLLPFWSRSSSDILSAWLSFVRLFLLSLITDRSRFLFFVFSWKLRDTPSVPNLCSPNIWQPDVYFTAVRTDNELHIFHSLFPPNN